MNATAKIAVERDPDLKHWLKQLEVSLKVELDAVSHALNAKVLGEAVKKVAGPIQTAYKAQIDPFFPPDLPDASNRLDMLFRPEELPSWRIGLEICTDNRQAIAMNLFKLEAMNRIWQRESASSHQGLGLALTIAKDVRSSRWDGAVGTSQDYEYALQKTFASDLSTAVGLLVIDF